MHFQLTSVEVVDRAPTPYFNKEDLLLDRAYNRVTAQSEQEPDEDVVCVLFGVSAAGCSVCVRVSGFRPHFYVEITRDVTADALTRAGARLGATTTVELLKKAYGWVPAADNVADVRLFPFMRFEFSRLSAMARARYRLEKGMVDGLAPTLSETRVSTTEKFLGSRGLKPGGWVRVIGGTAASPRITVSHIELEVASPLDLSLHESDAMAPFLIASVDIECMSSDHSSFPCADVEGDEVIAIGTTFWVYGESSPRRRVMQMLSSVPGNAPDRLHYKTEYELLVGWRDLVTVEANPDFVTSYNGTGFDYAYMARRVARLGRVTRFCSLGRFVMQTAGLKTKELSSAAKGQNKLSWFPMAGRVQFDMFLMVKDEHKLSSYRLDDVAQHFLSQEKVVLAPEPGLVVSLLAAAAEFAPPVAPSDALAWTARVVRSLEGQDDPALQARFDALVRPIMDMCGDNNYQRLFRMYSGSGDWTTTSHAAIAEYCQVDCNLVAQLVDRLNVLPNLLQMSFVTNTLPDDVCNRGQQIKTFNLLARYARNRGFVLNFVDVGWEADATYEGAKVLEPVVGYYDVPVVTLDFASLYPSLIRAHNLCFSSLVLDPAYLALPGAHYESYYFGGTKTWTFQTHAKGLLPDILESLLDARKAKKKEMKAFAKGSLQYRLCDGAQLALKVSCNSVYGFCGTGVKGTFPCMPVAAATTANGRRLIAETQAFVTAAPYHATVIYGDTDSVMLTFPGVTQLAPAFELGQQVAHAASCTFAPVQLEFEKVFMPYLLVKKKFYAGMKYEDDPGHAPVMDVKGLANKRRDNCALVRRLMDGILESTMVRRDPAEAYHLVESALQDLVCGRVSLADLVITSSLRGTASVVRLPQVEVVAKMRKRKAFDVPRSGDRVPYVVCRGPAKARVWERAEHPRYVAEKGLKPDVMYYIDNQLHTRVHSILQYLPVSPVDALFAHAAVRARAMREGTRSLLTYFKPKAELVVDGWGETIKR